MKGKLSTQQAGRFVVSVAAVVLIGLIVASLVFFAVRPTNVPVNSTNPANTISSNTPSGRSPYVVVEVVELTSTTYTTTFTTTPQPHILVVVQPNVVVGVNNSGTYTYTTTSTYTTTTWS